MTATAKAPTKKYRPIAIPEEHAERVFAQLREIADRMSDEQGMKVPLWFAAAKAIEIQHEARGEAKP